MNTPESVHSPSRGTDAYCPGSARVPVSVFSLAFSLVEVVMALGLVAFVLVAILGLLPVGLRQAGDASEEMRAVNILSTVAADRMTSVASGVSTNYGIPALVVGDSVSTNTFLVKDTGELTANATEARYRVAYSLHPPPADRADPFYLFLRLSWPAGNTNATPPPSAVESLVAIPQ